MTVAASIIKPTLLATTSRTWIDGEKLPATGGCIVAINHISHVDPLLSALFVYDHGRLPRYLAKSGLFANKYLGGLLTAAAASRRPGPPLPRPPRPPGPPTHSGGATTGAAANRR